MLVEVANIPISLDALLPGNDGLFLREVIRKIGVKPKDLQAVDFISEDLFHGLSYGDRMYVLRRSIDARKKSNVHFVLTILLNIASIKNSQDLERLRKRLRNGISVRTYQPRESLMVPNLAHIAAKEGYRRPVVVGAGPAGLFAALYLARAGLRPIVVERGKPVDERIGDVDAFVAGGPLDPNSNVQFGEGGAGTFSDGKLHTGIKSPHIRHVLEEFVSAGAPSEILVDAKPHIGTDLLPDVVCNIRKAIESAGGTFLFSTQLVGLDVRGVSDVDGDIAGESDSFISPSFAIHGVDLLDLKTGNVDSVETNAVILAIGHSARDTYQMLSDISVVMERKPFAVGVRIEHLQDDINKAQYGEFAEHPALGAADYKLAVHNDDGRGVYTFCMCPGGTVVCASSEDERLCVNGMSVHARDGVNANSALLVEVRPEDLDGDDVMAGIALQQKIEHDAYLAGTDGAGYKAPVQTVGSFLSGSSAYRDNHDKADKVRPTYPRGVVWTDLHKILPLFVVEAITEAFPKLDRKLHGFADPQAIMTGVEARSSSPVRIIRDRDELQSVSIAGLYPAGEGAGYAGGIMSAAVDGIRVAEKITNKYLECTETLHAN